MTAPRPPEIIHHIRMTDERGVRCQNPKCRTMFAERLDGTLTLTCRKCGMQQTIIIVGDRKAS